MRWAPDTSDKWAPDSVARDTWALDSSPAGITLSSAIDHFLTAKAAEGASPKTLDWYRMVLGRAGRDLGADRLLDSLTPAELRSWLLSLRATLAPISVAGYVRGLKAFGNWCALWRPAVTDFEFSTNEEARAYCERVLAEMVRLFSIERGEAIQPMNQHWGGQDMTGPDDVLILTRELPDYWARRIYYGPDAKWWARDFGPSDR